MKPPRPLLTGTISQMCATQGKPLRQAKASWVTGSDGREHLLAVDLPTRKPDSSKSPTCSLLPYPFLPHPPASSWPLCLITAALIQVSRGKRRGKAQKWYRSSFGGTTKKPEGRGAQDGVGKEEGWLSSGPCSALWGDVRRLHQGGCEDAGGRHWVAIH